MDIILPPKKNVIFDATLAGSFSGCKRFVDLRFNRNFVQLGGKSNSLETGSLAHKVLEVFYKHQINGFPRTTCIAQSLTAGQLYIDGCRFCASGMDKTPECGHEPGEYPGLENTPERSEGHLVGWKFVLDSMEQYFKKYENDSFIPLAAEHVKGKVIYEDENIRVFWKAKIDLLIDTNQDGVMTTDHKTFKQRRKKTKLSYQFKGHCILYGTRNVLVNKIGWQTTLKVDERMTRELISYSAAALLEWQGETIPYYAYQYLECQESGYWPPNYSQCDGKYGPCPYMNVCESDPNMREHVLRTEYMIGPVWDPQNKDED